MPPRRKLSASYLLHKQTGRARAVWTDSAGVRHFRMLPGPCDSAESRTAFAQLALELAAAPHFAAPRPGVSVNELLCAFLDFAERHYLDPDGRPTDEVRHVKTVIRYVRESYGVVPAAGFGPLALKAVRQKFLDAGWCRKKVDRDRGELGRRVGVGRTRAVNRLTAGFEFVGVTRIEDARRLGVI